MADETTTLNEPIAGPLERLQLGGTVQQAIDNGIAATGPVAIGDYGLVVRTATGAVDKIIDVREFEDADRFPRRIQPTVGVASFCQYLNAHKFDDITSVYQRSVYGSGTTLLTTDSLIATGVIDDHQPAGNPDVPVEANRRRHQVTMTLRPTAAARRWGSALGKNLSQHKFRDLVVDGVAEIVDPPAADLRELVSNLFAASSTEVKSVIRNGGQGTIELAENVRLVGGQGHLIEFPEQIRITLQPFAGIVETIELLVKVAPNVNGAQVMFTLEAPGVEDALAVVTADVADEIEEATGISPIFTP